jgi:predicted Zn-dependent peptidase
MSWIRLTLAAVALLTLSPMRVAASAGKADAVVEFVLANGLHVVIAPDRTLPVAAIALAVRSGSARDEAGARGTAHVLEHLVFLAAQRPGSGGTDALSAEIGGSGASGSTTADITVYRQSFPSDAIGVMLWAEAEKLALPLTALGEARFEAERRVVLEELAADVETAPFGGEEAAIAQGLFPDSPYSYTTLGERRDIEALRLAEVARYHSVNYTPNNAVLVIAGDVDPRRVRAQVEQYFGGLPRGPELPSLQVMPHDPPAPRLVLDTARTARSSLTMAWGVEGIPFDRLPVLLLTEKVLAARADRRDPARAERDHRIEVAYEGRGLAGIFSLRAELEAGVAHDPALAAFQGFLDEAKSGITQDELEQARLAVMREVLGSSDGVENRAAALARFTALTQRTSFFSDLKRALDRATVQSVEEQVARLLIRPALILSVVPQGELSRAVTGAVPIAKISEKKGPVSALGAPSLPTAPPRPPLERVRARTGPATWTATIGKTTAVVSSLYPAWQLQYAQLRLALPDPAEPAADAAARILVELARAGRLGRESTAGEGTRRAARSWSFDPRGITLDLVSLPGDMMASLEAADTALRSGGWTDEDFVAARTRALQSLDLEEGQLRASARLHLLQLLTANRIAPQRQAVEAELRAMTTQRLRMLRAGWIDAARTHVLMRGPLERDRAGVAVAGKAVARPVHPGRATTCSAALTPRDLLLLRRPDTQGRAQIAIGALASRQGTQQRDVDELLAYMLGGSLGAPLSRRLREELSLTTSIRARVTDEFACPATIVSLATSSANAMKALEAVRATIGQFASSLDADAIAAGWRSMQRASAVTSASPMAPAALEGGSTARVPTLSEMRSAYARLWRGGRIKAVVLSDRPSSSEIGDTTAADRRLPAVIERRWLKGGSNRQFLTEMMKSFHWHPSNG